MREVVIGISTALGVLVILWFVGLIGKIPIIIAVPPEAVVAFNSKECPSEGKVGRISVGIWAFCQRD